MYKYALTHCVAFAGVIFSASTLVAFRQQDDLEERQIAVTTKKFLSIVEKNPQRGTALEKVFAFHLQRGTLDNFIGEQEKRTESNPNDDVAWMLIGLMESQRRMDQKAIRAFTEAERLRPNDPLPAYYRGQSLIRTGEPEQAVQALEIAVSRKPTRIVLLELFELLGRTHQRQNRNDLALACWKRLEDMFPDDLRVLEQIASAQNREGAYQDALPRYEKLIQRTKDATLRTQFRIDATQLRIKLGDNARGLIDLEDILAELKPDGWLYRDVQRKIEEVYLGLNDQSGLIAYYEKRLTRDQDDIESILRLAKFLAMSDRRTEANQWIQKAIERAPSRVDLRRSYIERLLVDQEFSAAAEQYAELFKLNPNDPDILREWGKTVLRDPMRSADQAKSDASEIWHRILSSRSEEALAHLQVAELFQSSQMPVEAEKLFQRAIAIAPDEAQYREYFGDFLFKEDRIEEAFAVWDAIAAGPRRSAATVMRLAEIYHHAKRFTIAANLAKETCGMVPTDPLVFLRAARLQTDADQIDEALESLASAMNVADGDDQREFVLQEQIRVLEKGGRLAIETNSLQLQLRLSDSAPVTQLQLLTRYLVRLRRWKEAKSTVEIALRKDPNNLPMLNAASEIAEGLGDISLSIQSLRKLADIDRRRRQEYLERIARQQLRQKKWTEAIGTAQEAIQSAPSKIEGYEFMAQICSKAKKYDLGIETLRKALRIDPSSNRVIVALGHALAERQNYSEAIELYWQAFVKSSSLVDRIELTSKLVKLVQQQSASSKFTEQSNEPLTALIDRLQDGRKDLSLRRDFTICLAHVYQATSDFSNAKLTLEELLTDRSRDTEILQQLARLSESVGQLEIAIDYQQQLVALAPGQENEAYLANLHRQLGDLDAANRIVLKLLLNERDPESVVKNIDALLQQGECELVLQAIEPMLQKLKNHWKLLYRKGLAHAGIDQWVQARNAFEAILDLELDPNEMAARPSTSNSSNLASLPSSIGNAAPSSQSTLSVNPREEIERGEFLDIAVGQAKPIGGSSSSNSKDRWKPETFFDARLGSMAWLVCCESKDSTVRSAWIADTLKRTSGDAARQDYLDAIAIARFRQDLESQIAILSRIAMSGEQEMQTYYLMCLQRRQVSGIPADSRNRSPLASWQLDLMLESFEATESAPVVRAPPFLAPTNSIPAWTGTQTMQQLLAAQQNAMQQAAIGQFYAKSSAAFSNPPNSIAKPRKPEGFVKTIVNELRFAGEPEKAEAFLAKQSDSAQTEFKLSSLCEYLLTTRRYAEVEKPLIRWFESNRDRSRDANVPSGVTGTPAGFALRFLDALREKATPELAKRMVELAIANSNDAIRRRSFEPLTAMSFSDSQTTLRTNGLAKRVVEVPLWFAKFVPTDLFVLIQSAKELYARDNRTKDWTDFLNRRVDSADVDLQPFERLRLVLFGANDDEQRNEPRRADALVIREVQNIGKLAGCQLHAAVMLLNRDQPSASRSIAQSYNTSDPQEQLIRELILLLTSVTLSDPQQIDKSMQFINSRPVDIETMAIVNYALQEANATDLKKKAPSSPNQSRAVVRTIARAFSGRTPARPPNSLASPNISDFARIKDIQEKQNTGNLEDAIQLAKQIVSKPRVLTHFSPFTGMNQASAALARSTLPPGTSGTPLKASSPSSMGAMSRVDDSALREFAFRFLKENGALKTLIEETEKSSLAFPNSFRHLELLVEYYEEDGDTKQAKKAMLNALRLRPSSHLTRLHLARLQSSSREASEACDQYLELIRRDPNFGLPLISQSLPVFQSTNRTEALAKAIEQSNFQCVARPQDLFLQATSLFEDKETREAGLALLEKFADLDSSWRRQVLYLVYGKTKNVYPDLFRFTLTSFIPNGNDVSADPWCGLGDDSRLLMPVGDSCFFESILRSHPREVIIDQIEPAIEEGINRMPDWYAGPVLLAMAAAHTERHDILVKRIAQLKSNPHLLDDCPETTAFRLAQLFLTDPDSQNIACQMLESLVSSDRFNHLELTYRPMMVLAKKWVEMGERTKALEMITREFRTANETLLRLASKGIAMRRISEDEFPTLGNIILEMGLPVDSFRIFNVHRGQAQRAREMARNLSVTVSNRAGKADAVRMLNRLSPEQAIFECLQDRSDNRANFSALELMFQVPRLQNAGSRQIESELQKVLVKHSANGMAAEIDESLYKLSHLHPSDISIPSTQARIQLAIGNNEALPSLIAIERILKENHKYLESSESVEKASTQFPSVEVAYSVASLWLVAKQCYIAREHLDVAERLASHALKAAIYVDGVEARLVNYVPNSAYKESMPEAEFANIMLLEWGQSQVRSGLNDQGLATWRKLIDRICIENPFSQSNPSASNVNSTKPSGAPWTKHQFDWLMRIASIAADETQRELAAEILGLIVQSPLPAPAGSRTIVENATMPAARAILKLIDRLGSGQFSPRDRYDMLLPIFLPRGNNDVFLYQEQSRLLDEKPIFLASTLVEAAAQLDCVNELKDQIIRRERGANTLASLVLKTHLAMVQKDIPSATECLKELQGNLQAETSFSELETACHAAIPAFEIVELKEVALPILQAYLEREKANGNYPESDLQFFRLVRQIKTFLETKGN